MFAIAYMGRKRILPMLSLHLQRLLKGLRPVFWPMYAQANMGHPSREQGLLFAPGYICKEESRATAFQDLTVTS